MMDYKEEVIKSAINGMIQGGMSRTEAEIYRFFLTRVYDCGYNECRRNVEEQLYLHSFHMEDGDIDFAKFMITKHFGVAE